MRYLSFGKLSRKDFRMEVWKAWSLRFFCCCFGERAVQIDSVRSLLDVVGLWSVRCIKSVVLKEMVVFWVDN